MWIRESSNGTILVCRIHPNARKDSLDPPRDDRLVIHLNAPAVEGKANKALIKFLSERLDLAKTRISIRMGEKGRTKVLLLSGVGPDEVKKRLGITGLP